MKLSEMLFGALGASKTKVVSFGFHFREFLIYSLVFFFRFLGANDKHRGNIVDGKVDGHM